MTKLEQKLLEDTDTYTVKRVHKWTYTENVRGEECIDHNQKDHVSKKFNGKEGLSPTRRGMYTSMNQPSCILIAMMQKISKKRQ